MCVTAIRAGNMVPGHIMSLMVTAVTSLHDFISRLQIHVTSLQDDSAGGGTYIHLVLCHWLNTTPGWVSTVVILSGGTHLMPNLAPSPQRQRTLYSFKHKHTFPQGSVLFCWHVTLEQWQCYVPFSQGSIIAERQSTSFLQAVEGFRGTFDEGCVS